LNIFFDFTADPEALASGSVQNMHVNQILCVEETRSEMRTATDFPDDEHPLYFGSIPSFYGLPLILKAK
jgi:hypothetical protein